MTDENKETKDPVHSMDNAGKEQVGTTPPPVLKETAKQTIERQEQEIKDLKAIASSQPAVDAADAKYMQDIDYLSKQKQGTNRIEVKAISDHKNISLWTEWGKRIGPLHPNNARFVYHKFRRLGRILFVHKPSEDQILTYYKSPKYLKWKEKFDKDRVLKNKSKSKDGMKEVLTKMAEITGQTQEALVQILDRPAVAAPGG